MFITTLERKVLNLLDYKIEGVPLVFHFFRSTIATKALAATIMPLTVTEPALHMFSSQHFISHSDFPG